MKLLHFCNESTNKEYIVLSDEDPSEWAQSGFKLESSTEIDDAPCALPTERILAARN